VITAILGGVSAIFSAISGIAQGWFQHRIAATQATRDTEIAQIRAGVEAQQGSWKDEWVTVVFTVPFVLAMFGWSDPLVRMFNIMAVAPDWFHYILYTIVGGSFGVNMYQKVQGVRANGKSGLGVAANGGVNTAPLGNSPGKPETADAVRDEYLKSLGS